MTPMRLGEDTTTGGTFSRQRWGQRCQAAVPHPMTVAVRRCHVDHPQDHLKNQWEIQDPNMEVLYHIRPYFAGIFPQKLA